MNVLLIAFVSIVFIVGLATPWLIAWTLSGLLPSWIAEPLANLSLTVAFSTAGAKLLNFDDDGRYRVESVRREEVDNADQKWTAFAGAPFTVGYECTERAFGRYTRDIDIGDMYETAADPLDTKIRAVTDISRGGFETFVDTTHQAKQASIHVLAGEFLARLKGVGGARETQDAESAAMYKFGGDTSAESPKVRLVGAVIFALLGIGTAWLIFI